MRSQYDRSSALPGPPGGRSFSVRPTGGQERIEILGHSGCGVEIVHEAEGLTVVKSALDAAYSGRLRRQVAKQAMARSANSLSFIRIPAILSDQMTDGRYSATMEYVYFDNAVRFFRSASQETVGRVTDMLLAFIDDEVDRSSPVEHPVALLREKLDGISSHLSAHADTHELYRPYLVSLDRELVSRGSLELPLGCAHGDLTFSNVMISSDAKSLALLDFLDGFIESPLMDLAKLRQDTRFRWTLLMTGMQADRVRFGQVMTYIDRRIESHFGQHHWYADTIDIALQINLLRIVPYAVTDEVHTFILRSLASLRTP